MMTMKMVIKYSLRIMTVIDITNGDGNFYYDSNCDNFYFLLKLFANICELQTGIEPATF